MNEPVLQSQLPQAPWMDPALWRLPGTVPLDPENWLLQDDAFVGQMAERDRLIASRPGDVLALCETSRPAVEECLALVLEALRKVDGYSVSDRSVVRPDTVRVPLDRSDPIGTIGRLIQEDVCILESGDRGEHVLGAAALCFPASWTLSEKIGQPLGRIHTPVSRYTEDIAGRVQRMFDVIRPETPLMRANALLYERPDLYQPRSEAEATTELSERVRYLRSERQTLRRLPGTRAVVFTIHTFVVPVDALTTGQRASLSRVADRYAE